MEQFKGKIFSGVQFEELAMELFRFQSANNPIYRKYIEAIGRDAAMVKSLTDIPFLPIRFFKTHPVVTTEFEPQVIFESSGTTGSINSKHLVKDVGLYAQSFMKAFEQFYGDIKEYCILGLLPSYLERGNSSLVLMVDRLIKESGHPKSGFYLNELEDLSKTLNELEAAGQKTILIGVTYALIDFAERFPQELKHTIIMETGGMKGRRRELIRPEVHDLLKQGFGVDKIHSEYGMTELLSQAYSNGAGIFNSPPWMCVALREESDPLSVSLSPGRGVLNIIDLANIYSCSFIATDDLGVLHKDESFEVLGRMDNAEVRGCSLLAL